MKYLFMLFLFFISGSLLSQNSEEERLMFVNTFIDAVKTHDQKAILKHIDKSYKKEQLKLLKGNKSQFINELFSGINEMEEYKTPELSDIMNVELIDMKAIDDTNYNCAFEVETGDNVLYVELVLSLNKKKLGFVGAVG